MLVAEKDVDGLAAAMERLRDDPAERARLGAAAKKTPLAQMTWDDTAVEFEALYRRAAERAR